jgi:hypothetical protein
MIVVDYDNQSVVKFYCDKCNFHGEYDISSLLTDNCAVDVDVICDLCGEYYVLYVLKCKDAAQAKELNARLEFLKIKRAAEEKEDGNQGNESSRD